MGLNYFRGCSESFNMEKDFTTWHKTKDNLQKNAGTSSFREREIWWCGIGINIGDEEDGKGSNFRRPVLIIRKFNKKIFWGVPLTTQIKDNPNYHKIHFKEKIQCAMLTQLKLYDSKRLGSKMRKLTKTQVDEVRNALIGIMAKD